MLDFDQKFEEDLLGGEIIPDFTVEDTTEKEEHKNTESKPTLTKKGKPRQRKSPAAPRKPKLPR